MTGEGRLRKRTEMPCERPAGLEGAWARGHLCRVFRDQVRNVSTPLEGPRVSCLWHRRPLTGIAIAEAVAETDGSTQGWPIGALVGGCVEQLGVPTVGGRLASSLVSPRHRSFNLRLLCFGISAVC